MKLYDFLLNTYGEDEPIFVSDIKMKDMTDANIRQQMRKLVDEDKIRRFDTGIYFIPKKTVFRSGSQLSVERVIEQKYLKDKGCLCGYVSGLMFANQIGITSQVPLVYEIVTNKATTEFRETSIAKTKLIIRKPKTLVTAENATVLQFLDLIKDIDFISELSGEMLTKALFRYMEKTAITFSGLQPYLKYYPDKIYKNLYEIGLLIGQEL